MAGARKSRASKNPQVERVPYAVRKVRSRSTLPIIIVVCDDRKAAVAYFEKLKRQVKSYVTVHVVRAPHDGASPAAVVRLAIDRYRALGVRAARDRWDKESVWALIDLEGEPARQSQAWDQKHRSGEAGIGVALSLPCYDLWTLLHLENTGRAFADCRAVVSRIRQQWEKEFQQAFGSKAKADYGKIMKYMPRAIARAEQHREAKDRSWTEVYLVVKDILRYAGGEQ